MKKIFIQILKIISTLTGYITDYINKEVNRLNDDQIIKVTETYYNSSDRCLSIHLTNTRLLEHREVLESIFTTLMNNKEFTNFGNYKIIIITGVSGKDTFNFHHNVLINNSTSFEKYYKSIEDVINGHYNSSGYISNAIPEFIVEVWNMDDYRNKNIKRTRTTLSKRTESLLASKPKIQSRAFSTSIRPIKADNIDSTVKQFATMDIETIDFNGNQIPIAISTTYFDETVKSKIFLINHRLIENNLDSALKKMWSDYFDFAMENKQFFETIFVHNLGSFDGYFLYKALINQFDEAVESIIDDKNKFIYITLNCSGFKIGWKDSYRIFPVSLNELCKVFKVQGKTSDYNMEFNNIDLFNKPDLLSKFIDYSIQDSIALYNALDHAQTIYSNEQYVDITTILSTSTLSLKIFRQNFLKNDIPILRNSEDSFIRKGYFGGATDYYKGYGENLHYYDVNSLYPHAMLKPMPLEMSKKYNDMSSVDFDKFFGFCLAEII